MEFTRPTAERPAALCARRCDGDHQIVGPMPADRPQRPGAGFAEEIDVMAPAVEVFDIQLGRGPTGVVVDDDHRDALVIWADRKHAPPRRRPGRDGRRATCARAGGGDPATLW